MSDVEQVKRLLDEIAAERRKAGQIRLVSIGIVLLMFGGFASSVYSRIQSFDTDALLVGLQESASTTVWPMVSRELDQVGNDAVPALSDAMNAEMDSFGPRLVERLNAESEQLQTNLHRKMKTSLDGHISEQFSAMETPTTPSVWPCSFWLPVQGSATSDPSQEKPLFSHT